MLTCPLERAVAMPKETENSRRPTASSMATTSMSSRVRGPSALYCRTTIKVAAGAVADAMAPSTMAQGRVMTWGKHRCRPISTISTSTVVTTACKMPMVMAALPMAFSWVSRNSLPMVKAMKPRAVCVTMLKPSTCSKELKPRPGNFNAPRQKGPSNRPATK